MAIQLNHRTNTITTGVNAETAGITLNVNNTGSLTLPRGNDAARPGGAVAGDFRYNTTSNTLEYYNGSVWVTVIGGYVEDLRDQYGNLIVDGQTVAVASANLNYLTVSNASTTNPVVMGVAGVDTNISLQIASKGTGDVDIYNGTNLVASFSEGGAVRFDFKGGASKAEVSANGDLDIRANIVNIYDQTNKVAEFRHNAGNDALLVETVASGVLISVSGTVPKELQIGQDLDMKNNYIVNLADPVALQDAATKAYVDNAINGLDWKQSVKVATVSAIGLSGLPTVDGVSLVSGDRILVKDQTDQTTNGIYIAVTGDWSRSPDADENSEVTGGMAVFSEAGTVNADTGWLLINITGEADLGTDNLVFTQFTGAGSLILVGRGGVDTTQSGNIWYIDAAPDNATIWASGVSTDKLSVYAASAVPAGRTLIAVPGTDAVWGAINLNNSNVVTGVLNLANGGTGLSTVAAGSLVYGPTSGSALSTLAIGTSGMFLRSNGAAPVWVSATLGTLDGVNLAGAVSGNVLRFDGDNWIADKVNLQSGNAVSGVLNVQNGGTGLNSVPAGALVFGTGGSALQNLTIGASSDSDTAYILMTTSAGATVPSWNTISFNQLSDVTVSGAANGDILVYNGTNWVPSSATANDRFVRITSTDTASGYLNDKLTAGSAISLVVYNSGANEGLRVNVTVDTSTIFVNNTNNLAVFGGATAGQVLRSIGSAGTAEWGALDLSNPNAVTGILDLTYGGTGLNAVPAGSLLYGPSSGSALSTLAIGTSGRFLRSNGTAPVWVSATLGTLDGVNLTGAAADNVLRFDGTNWVSDKVNLESANAVSGVLQVQNGGTGLSAVQAGAIVIGNNATSLTVVSAGTPTSANTAYVLLGTGSAPAYGTITLNQLSDVSAVGASAGDVLFFNGTEWLPTPSTATDKLVRITSNDTTSGYLNDKLTAGSAISLVVYNSGANEGLRVNVTTDNTTVFVNAGNNLGVRSSITAGQVLRSIGSAGTAEWGALDLSNGGAAVTGVLNVQNGGTGLNAVAQGSLVYGIGGSSLATLPIGTSSTAQTGYVLMTGETTAAPVWNVLNLGQLGDVDVSGAVSGQIIQYDGTNWVNTELGAIDKLVRVSPTDTTSGYLNGKLVAGSAISFAVVNASANEALRVNVIADVSTVFVNNANRLAVAGGSPAGQVLKAIGSAGTAEWGWTDTLYNNSGDVIVVATGSGSQLQINATTSGITVSSNTNLYLNGASGVYVAGTQFPTSAPERSVLVANTNNVLSYLTASPSANQVLRWNVSTSAFEFILQTDVGGFAFALIETSGNGNGVDVSATSTNDTLSLVGGAGIAVNGATKQITLAMTTSGVGTGNASANSVFTFFNGTTLVQSELSAIFDENNVVSNVAGQGLVVATSGNTYVTREIVAFAAGSAAGITVFDTAGSAGNIRIGLDINNLVSAAPAASDYVVVFNVSTSANTKTTVSSLVAASLDTTRIYDAGNTTYVDTDEVANKVVVYSSGNRVALFEGLSAQASGIDQYFVFNTTASAGVIRLNAEGSATNLSIRLTPKGNGQVFVGSTGDGIIQAEDTFNLTVAGGNSGGDLNLKGGTSGGEVNILTAASAQFVTFGSNQEITHYATNVNALSNQYILTGTTTNATPTSIGTIAVTNDSTMLFEGYIVARDQSATDTTKSVGYKFRGVVANATGTAALVDTLVEEIVAEGTAATGYSATIAASGGNIEVTVTGGASDNVRWAAFVRTVAVIH